MSLDCEGDKLLKDLAALRLLLMDGEQDLGLAHLSGPQRDVYYAVSLLQAEQGAGVKASQIIEHDLVANIPRATFYRALKFLHDKGLITECPNAKRAFRIT